MTIETIPHAADVDDLKYISWSGLATADIAKKLNEFNALGWMLTDIIQDCVPSMGPITFTVLCERKAR